MDQVICRELRQTGTQHANHELDAIEGANDIDQSNDYFAERSIEILRLLSVQNDQDRDVSSIPNDDEHALRVAPLFSRAVHAHARSREKSADELYATYTDYGILGLQREHHPDATTQGTQERIVLGNTKEPFSTFICGSQGSGKSHTLSCLLENSLVEDPRIGVLNSPLAGMVFHYDKFAGYQIGQICESAYLHSTGIQVRVLVAPTSLQRMKKQYSNLPGAPRNAPQPQVLPLYFSDRQLSVDAMMTLMAVQDTGVSAPLYICAVRQVLRDMALTRQDSPGFDYIDFRNRLAALCLDKAQSTPLNLRLGLLESFLLSIDQNADSLNTFKAMWRFEPGTLTIVDLSDPFVSEGDACALFSICLKIFMDGWRSNPRIVALDEAHKFLTDTSEATLLTDNLVSIIRQQRHLNSRVVIATQEPTLAGELLDLCNVSIVHRFNSPKWYATIKAHLAGARSDAQCSKDLFPEIVKLRTGDALVFAPTAVLVVDSFGPKLLSDEYIRIKIRARISADGGRSMVATDNSDATSTEPLLGMPVFLPFDGSSLPRPGSLAGKSNTKQKVPTVPNPPRSHTTGKLVQRPKSPVTQNEATAAEGPINLSSLAHAVAIRKNVNPGCNNPDVSQPLLESRLRSSFRDAVRTNAATLTENPKPVLNRILKSVSTQCGLPPKYLKTQDVTWNGVQMRAMNILKTILHQHYVSAGRPALPDEGTLLQ